MLEANTIVDATPGREHIKKLARAGVGLRTISEAAGVPHSKLKAIRAGTQKHIRSNSLNRILRVSTQCRSDAALVPAASTLRRIEALIEEGFTPARIAQELGRKSPVLNFNRYRVTVRTRARVEMVFERLTT